MFLILLGQVAYQEHVLPMTTTKIQEGQVEKYKLKLLLKCQTDREPGISLILQIVQESQGPLDPHTSKRENERICLEYKWVLLKAARVLLPAPS